MSGDTLHHEIRWNVVFCSTLLWEPAFELAEMN